MSDTSNARNYAGSVEWFLLPSKTTLGRRRRYFRFAVHPTTLRTGAGHSMVTSADGANRSGAAVYRLDRSSARHGHAADGARPCARLRKPISLRAHRPLAGLGRPVPDALDHALVRADLHLPRRHQRVPLREERRRHAPPAAALPAHAWAVAGAVGAELGQLLLALRFQRPPRAGDLGIPAPGHPTRVVRCTAGSPCSTWKNIRRPWTIC